MRRNQTGINKGTIFEEDSESQPSGSREEGEIIMNQEDPPMEVEGQEELYESSDAEQDLQEEKRKRERIWKHQNDEQLKLKELSQQDCYARALHQVEITNTRVMMMRYKNEQRMTKVEDHKANQSNAPHSRGTAAQYSTFTMDQYGNKHHHPNPTLRIGELKLQSFLAKNIREEATANYLNEMLKYENYVPVQRKKRRSDRTV